MGFNYFNNYFLFHNRFLYTHKKSHMFNTQTLYLIINIVFESTC